MSEATVDLGRLIEYRLKGLSYQDIGDLVGLSPNSVMVRLKRHEALLQAAQDAPSFELLEGKVLAGLRGSLLARAFNCATAESGSKDELSGYQAMGMYGIAFDKSRTLEGKSNFNMHVLTELVARAEESGDDALRKLSIQAPKVKDIRQFSDANVVDEVA